jgi:outer membrane lipoprotein-sorting protein
MKKFFLLGGALIVGSCLLAHPAFAELTAEEIVKKVDEVRNPELDYETDVKIVSYKPNRPDHASRYTVFIKGKDKTIVKTTEPEIERGQALLMRENDFWAFFPEVSKPVRISLQQRLNGDVANGDIARTNFSGDYSSTINRKETISGKEFYVLELVSLKDSTTYGKVVLWVMAENFWPVKAEFYAISGRFLKTCSYENYKTMAGKLRPSKLVLKDAVVKGQYSTIEYSDMTLMEIPEKNFTKEYLNKLVQ